MKKLDTIFDTETGASYDLYRINAKVIKKALDKSYNLTPLKFRMFNGEENLLSTIAYNIKYHNLKFNWKKGKILNLKEFLKMQKEEDIYQGKYGADLSDTSTIKNITNETYSQMGFELMPIAISLQGKNIKDISNIELLDGFKRMFCTIEIPDRDILVKVYDVLTTPQWINAMLMFNSWKLADKSVLMNSSRKLQSFLDRGFKLGLWKHFNIDLTIGNNNISELIAFYLNAGIFSILKNNNFIASDIEYIIKLDQHFSTENEASFKEILMKVLGTIRGVGYRNRDKNQAFNIEDILALANKSGKQGLEKHFKKINSMTVTGFIENYINKNMMPIVITKYREILGLEKKEIIVNKNTYSYYTHFEDLNKQGV